MRGKMVYTVKEIAEILKLDARYIRNEISRGNLKAEFHGKRAGYRIREIDLEKWRMSKQQHNYKQ